MLIQNIVNKIIAILGTITMVLLIALPLVYLIDKDIFKELMPIKFTPTPTPTRTQTPTPPPTFQKETQQIYDSYTPPVNDSKKTYKCKYDNCGIVESLDPSFCDTQVCCETAGRWSVMSSYECSNAQREENEYQKKAYQEQKIDNQNKENEEKCRSLSDLYTACLDRCLGDLRAGVEADCHLRCDPTKESADKYCSL